MVLTYVTTSTDPPCRTRDACVMYNRIRCYTEHHASSAKSMFNEIYRVIILFCDYRLQWEFLTPFFRIGSSPDALQLCTLLFHGVRIESSLCRTGVV